MSWSLLAFDQTCSVLLFAETAVASFPLCALALSQLRKSFKRSPQTDDADGLRFQSESAPRDRAALRFHSEVDCLMLWKLTREGDVGMDMAWVILARIECCSCHRWKRFLTAERTSLFRKQ